VHVSRKGHAEVSGHYGSDSNCELEKMVQDEILSFSSYCGTIILQSSDVDNLILEE
jgi:hypothetical protein